MKNNKIYYPLFLAMAVALGIFIGSMLDYPQKNAALLFNTNPQAASGLQQLLYLRRARH